MSRHEKERNKKMPTPRREVLFFSKQLTGESTAHGYICASPTKRGGNTPFKTTARSGTAIAEVSAGRSGRECCHTLFGGVTPLGGSPL